LEGKGAGEKSEKPVAEDLRVLAPPSRSRALTAPPPMESSPPRRLPPRWLPPSGVGKALVCGVGEASRVHDEGCSGKYSGVMLSPWMGVAFWYVG